MMKMSLVVMSELCGFESVDELCQAVEAWREMEKRAREIQAKASDRVVLKAVYWILTHILQPVDELDKAAGMKALEVEDDDSTGRA